MASRAGSPNKNKQFLLKRLQDMFGEDFDPVISAAQNAIRMQEIASNTNDPVDEFNQRKECVNAWDKIAQYVTPKLKSVELSGNEGEPLSIQIVNYKDSVNADS